MRIEFSLSGPGTCRDVAVTGVPTAPLDGVLGTLAELAGVPRDRPAWCDGQPLPAGVALGSGAIRTGSIVSFAPPPVGVPAPAVQALDLVGGAQAGNVVPLVTGRLTIGRAADCDLVLDDERASRHHAVVDVDRSAFRVRDLGSTNGTTLDGCIVTDVATELHPGELVRMGDTLLCVDAGSTPRAAVTARGADLVVNRAPRAPRVPDAPDIALPAEPERQVRRRTQWAAALVPALAGGLLAWFLHAPQFLLFALLSPVVLASGALGDHVHGRRSSRRAWTDFARDRAAGADRVRAGLAAETTLRRWRNPDPAAVRRIAVLPGSRLWERTRADPDHLSVRVGTADRPAALRSGVAAGWTSAGVLPTVPVGIDLRDGAVGLTGPIEVIGGVARWTVAQVAALHPPADVELVLLLTPRSAPRWEWARWLPHTRDTATSADERSASLDRLITSAVARSGRSRPDRTPWSGCWTVVVVDDAGSGGELAALPGLLASGPASGITALWIGATPGALPSSCTTVVAAADDSGTRLTVLGNRTIHDVVADRVHVAWAEEVARALAPLVDGGTGPDAALPAVCALGDLLDLAPDAVERRWRANPGGARTVVGVGPDTAVTIDLVAQGPHTLIAGTTGSGKSELLRSLVVGLASNHPPDGLTFLLVDYKGGAAFGACAALPHVAGLVTDLDPQLTRRALRSLHAELRRREQLFAAAGVCDVAGFHAHGGTPDDDGACPRLVIVVDEFAALADELPEFLTGLIGVAQRGRSLGVHLVLATQRPGGSVSAEIRANTSLRIALRVTDPADSADVIDVPDAAWIAAGRPGRGLLRSGDEPVPFQTAQVGLAPAPLRPVVDELGPWRRRPAGPADQDAVLDSVVADLVACSIRLGAVAARSPWLDPLPADLLLSDLVPSDGLRTVVLPLGRLDDPDRRQQPLLTLDLGATESLLVVGRAGSGRSTALATLGLAAVEGSDPGRLELYVVDGRGPLAALLRPLPQVATAIGPGELDLVPLLLRRLDPAAGSSENPAHRLLLLDGWDSVLDGLDDDLAGRCADLLAGLLRAGTLTIAATGDRSLLLPRFAGMFGTRLLLALSDRNDYALAGVRLADVPAELPAGRGVRAGDGAVFQLARVGGADATRERVRACSGHPANGGNSGRTTPARSDTAVRLRALPSRVSLATAAAGVPPLVLGLAGDTAQPCRVDLMTHRARLLVAGPARSGKSVALCTMLVEGLRQGVDVVVAATTRSALTAAARQRGVPVLRPEDTHVVRDPLRPTLLLIDDSDAFADGPAADLLTAWVRDLDAPLGVVLAGRCDDLIATYRGPAPLVRRARCGVLLRPDPVDGELLGIRLGRRVVTGPPGRGLVVADPAWGPLFARGEPVPIQVAVPASDPAGKQ